MSSDSGSLLPDFAGGSYAARLGLALSLAIVVVVAFGVVISAQASADVKSDARQDLISLSQTQAAQLDQWLETNKRSVRTASDRQVFRDGEVLAINKRLRAMTSGNEVPRDVVAVHYLNTTTMTIEASSDPRFRGVNPREQGAPFATDPPTFDSPSDTYVSRPFSVSIVDHPVIAIISPVPGDGDHTLVYMADLEARANRISGMRNDTSTAVVGRDGQYVAHPNVSKITEQHSGGQRTEMDDGESGFMRHGSTLMGMTHLEETDWTVMVHAEAGQAYALSRQINSDLVGLVLLAVINLGLVGVTIGSSTVVSLRRLAARAEEMGDGDLSVDLTTTRNDEIGTLYRSFDRMRTDLKDTINDAEQARADAESARENAERERAEMKSLNARLESTAGAYGDVLSAAADGDLTVRVDPDEENDAMALVGEEINATLESLEETIADTKAFAADVLDATERVGRNAEEVDRASRQVSESIGEIFDGTSEQSEQLQEAAEEMETLSAAAQQVAASAQQVADTSQSAADVGEEGREAAQAAIQEMQAIESETDDTVAAINDLDEDLDEIGEIVSLITDVVEQTNMLALNASIEAAHADGDGDGFAVVADEIKDLAEETKAAAGDIEDRIERIQSQADETVQVIETTSDRVTDGVETVEEAVDALETIVEYTEEVDGGIQEIDRATEEQAETATEVMERIDELTEISQETATQADTVADAAEQQTTSIDEVAASASDLRRRTDELEGLLDRFTVEGVPTQGGATARGDD